LKLIFSLDPMLVSMTGIGRYTYELAKGLRDSGQFSDIRYQFLLGWVKDPDVIISKYHAHDKPHEGAPKSTFRKWIHSTARSIFFATSPTVKGFICRPYRGYIYHSPNFVLPNFAGKRVSTVHDMSVFRVPQFHPEHRIQYQQSIFPKLIKQADLFITVSEFSKIELIDFFKVSPDRVVSVPNGVDPLFHPRSEASLKPILEKYGLVANLYTLSVGTIEPRKNIECLIDVYASLPAALRFQFPLVLVGSYGWSSESIHQKIAKYSQEGWLKYLLFVPDHDLASIYAGARLFACISHYEGFGLPVLEAMASGVPVIASNAPALVEVGGDAVVYVDPNSKEAIRQAIVDTLGDDRGSTILSSRGLAQARRFSWGRCTQETMDAYRLIA